MNFFGRIHNRTPGEIHKRVSKELDETPGRIPEGTPEGIFD